MDTGRSTGGYISFSQGGPTDYGSHLPVPIAMSSGEAEYISAAVACMRASHLRKLTAGNRHVAKRYHYVWQGTALQEHKFEWIGTKCKLADPLTKPGSEKRFLELWKHIVHDRMD